MHIRRFVLSILVVQILLGFLGVVATNAAVLSSPQVVSFPFSDDFESGIDTQAWATDVNNGVVEINTIFHQSGEQSVFIGQKVGGQASASLILAVDLTNQKDVFLDFWVRARGSVAGRTVWINGDSGTNWTQVLDLSYTSQSFSHQILDIASLADAHGLPRTNQFRILFYFQHGSQLANDGFIIDDVRLTQRSQEIASFPLTLDSFEDNTFQQGFYPQSTVGGVTELSTLYPYGDSKQSVFLGQKVAGQATASLMLAVDLTNQKDAFLDFWVRATGNVAGRTVWISGDDGTNWTQVLDLSHTSQSFSHQILDIAGLAGDRIPLTNQFRILFYFQHGSQLANDGFIIDDIRLTQRSQEIASFPLTLDSFEGNTFQQGFYPQSTGGGIAELSTLYSRTGNQSVFLGQKVGGQASASLILAVDLTNQTDVLLDFWVRATGNDAQRSVWISDKGGSDWKKILDLRTTSHNFSHKILNISSAATINGLVLNNNFRILFYFGHGSQIANDGLVIDDVKLIKTSVSGKIYNETVAPGNEVDGAFVQICSDTISCQTTISQDGGSYQFGDLPAGTYKLRALPPAGSTHLIGNLGPITLVVDTPLVDQHIILPKANGIPAGTTVTPALPPIAGVPTINWTTSVLLTHKGCTGGTATYQVYVDGAVAREGAMPETPAGTYSVTLAPFRPVHGNIQLVINIRCPDNSQPTINFNIWIDPSGFVVNTFGAPIAGAKVSLYRAEAAEGPFDLVTSGSAVMSPANRVNPMNTDSTGRFGWDVIAGYYRVRAEKAGCTAPGNNETFAETPILTIPPPVTHLRVVLDCGGSAVFLPTVRR